MRQLIAGLLLLAISCSQSPPSRPSFGETSGSGGDADSAQELPTSDSEESTTDQSGTDEPSAEDVSGGTAAEEAAKCVAPMSTANDEF